MAANTCHGGPFVAVDILAEEVIADGQNALEIGSSVKSVSESTRIDTHDMQDTGGGVLSFLDDDCWSEIDFDPQIEVESSPGSGPFQAFRRGLVANRSLTRLWSGVKDANTEATKAKKVCRKAGANVVSKLKRAVAVPRSDGIVADVRQGADSGSTDAVAGETGARPYDEQVSRAARRVEEVARATASAAETVVKLTSNRLGRVALVAQKRAEFAHKTAAAWSVACSSSDSKEGEDLGGVGSTSSAHANSLPAVASHDKTSNADGAAPADRLWDTASSKFPDTKRARRLGGKIARRTREMSGDLLVRARDLGQDIQSSLVCPSAGGVCSFSDVDLDEACDGDSVFEIGSNGDDGDNALSDSDTERVASNAKVEMPSGDESGKAEELVAAFDKEPLRATPRLSEESLSELAAELGRQRERVDSAPTLIESVPSASGGNRADTLHAELHPIECTPLTTQLPQGTGWPAKWRAAPGGG